MSDNIRYSEADVMYSNMVSISIRNVATQMRINEIRDKMDRCDDYQMRDSLARQLKYLKSQIVEY